MYTCAYHAPVVGAIQSHLTRTVSASRVVFCVLISFDLFVDPTRLGSKVSFSFSFWFLFLFLFLSIIVHVVHVLIIENPIQSNPIKLRTCTQLVVLSRFPFCFVMFCFDLDFCYRDLDIDLVNIDFDIQYSIFNTQYWYSILLSNTLST